MTRKKTEITWALAVASNSKKILKANLLSSEDARVADEIIVLYDPETASKAYNEALCQASTDIIVFAHQDVFLPPGWSKNFSRVIMDLTSLDPNWGVVGLYGVTSSGEGRGYVYSNGLGRFVGRAFREPIQVRTLDELLLVLRRSSNLRFDEGLPGFHLYGTDICMEAEARGMRNYVVPCFVLHNSCSVKYLPFSFWKAYMYLRGKWKDRLPIVTPCTKITNTCTPILWDIIGRAWSLLFDSKILRSPVRNPKDFYNTFLAGEVETTEENK